MMDRRICLMSDRGIAPHLPAPPTNPERYRRIYQFNHGVDEVFHGRPPAWRTKRIPPGWSAAETYRLLPSLPDRELGGYLTRTRIHYVPGWSDGAYIPAAQPCTWHAHADEDRWADVPSLRDVYSFLRYRHRRHILVGAETLVVFDKTTETLATVAKLNAWEARHLVATIAAVGLEEYPRAALEGVGLRLPRSRVEYQRVWPRLLTEGLAIQNLLLARKP